MSFSIFDYYFLFDKVLKYNQTRDELRKYMKNVERNDELLSFYESCLELPSQSDQTKIHQMVKEIYDKFIDRNSRYNINVSAEVVKKVSNEVTLFLDDKERGKEEAIKLFKPALDSILNSLENDVFVRFIRSNDWIKYVKRKYKNEDEIEQIAVHKSQRKQMLLTIEDEDRLMITWRDILIAQNIMRDGVGWKLKYSTRPDLKYVDTAMYLKAKLKVTDGELEKRGVLDITKRVIVYNVSAKDLFHAMHAGEKQEELVGDPNLIKSTRIVKNTTKIEDNSAPEDIELNSKHYSLSLKVPLPLAKNRRMSVCQSSIYLPKTGRYVIMFKPMPDGVLPVEPSQMNDVIMRLYLWTIIEPIDESKCRNILITACDLAGNFKYSDSSFSKWFNSKVNISFLKDQLRRYDKVLTWYIDENNRPEVRDDTKTFELTAMNKLIANMVEKLF
jgi:hypothetical protein